MRRDFSAFLDLARVCAAATVFLGHLTALHLGADALGITSGFAHSAVIVFFVLSGYLIAWTSGRDGSLGAYAASRAIRIYSVALPALALTWLVEILLSRYAPGVEVTSYQLAQPLKYLPLFLGFATDFWWLSEDVLSNVPWWSLCYEVWYYVVFGVLVFCRGATRWLVAGAALALMGPRLWLLFPIWLLGAAVFAWHRRRALGTGTARLLLVLALAGLAAVKASGLETALNAWFDHALGGFDNAHLRYSRFVLGDSAVALLVALAILAARDARLGALALLRPLIAALASVSFSLYLVHYPLLIGFGQVFPQRPWTIGAATLAVASLFGIVFERRRDVWRRVLAGRAAPSPILPT